jgi:hypothetical protein
MGLESIDVNQRTGNAVLTQRVYKTISEWKGFGKLKVARKDIHLPHGLQYSNNDLHQ